MNYSAGQQVWLKATHLPDEGSSKALAERYKGPVLTEEIIGSNAAELRLPPSMLIGRFHVSLLKPVSQEPEHLKRRPEEQKPVAPDE